ncbi:MAG: serpin family protein [Chloroflexota bacterium]
MPKVLLSLLAVVSLLGLVACVQPVSAEVLQSNKPRLTPANVPSADVKAVVDGDTAFSLDLYKQLRQATPDNNLFYSPYSISLALAMTYGGARTDTEKAMATALHFTLPQDRLHQALNALSQELNKRGQGAKGKDDQPFRLHIVNAIWGQKDYAFLPSYLDLLAENYGAGLRVLDFKQAPDPSRVTINNWVSDQTEDRIKDLIPQGAITPLTRLVLTNAIYFNAAWLYQFEKSATSPGVFHLLDGKDVTVPIMRLTKSFGYASGNNYEAVELPYDGNEISMVILLPKAGQFAAFENSLDARLVDSAISSLKKTQVALTMPKFRIESSIGLKKALSGLGMGIAFTDNADFSGMTGKRELFISDAIHKAFVQVDESGTEAAAATAIIAPTAALPSQPVQVTIDRPFIFLIRDIKTGAVLFIGRVMNPA